MSEFEHEIKGHDYDGIRECDNPLPNWWLFTFYITIFFAFAYFLYYEVGKGPTLADELKVAMTEVTAVREANAPKQDAAESEDELKALFTAEASKAGEVVFTEKCASCHGPQLQGLIGPNLTDEYWIHGGKRADMVKTIRVGVADKGMPPWADILKKEEVYAVAAYIKSKKGSNPPNPKAPQGDIFTEE